MDFVARLVRDRVDQAMLLFQLRRIGAQAEFEVPARGGTDLQVRGTVAEDKVQALCEALGKVPGALHVDGKHWRLGKGAELVSSLQDAEAGLPGPSTVLGTTRSHWSFGGDNMDRVVQCLWSDGRLDVKGLHERTGLRVEEVMRALQTMIAEQVVRRYRVEGAAEQYDVAATVRSRLSAK